MATLRNDLFRRPELTPEEEAAYQASGMTEFGRAYEAGRITDEVNPMLADIARLRTSQNQADLARADELQRQVGALKLRQGVYAPTVGRVEDINGLGSAADWAAYQVGSGIASMQDPLAVSAGLQGAANLTSRGPGVLKPISAGLRGAGYAVPYLMGREQLIGENYGQMTEDPTLMQNTTAQQRYDAANLAGSAGAVLDTVVPGYIGGKLAGNGLRQGIARTGMGTRAGLTMGMEGATETGQGELGRMALSDLNPNRDTSGDMSMRLNEFAGGAIGAGPFAVAGAMADDGYRRTGATAETIGTKAGETIDLLSQKAGPYIDSAAQKVKDLAGKAGDKIDLNAFKGEDGKVDLGKLVSAAREGAVDLGEQARAAATGIDRDPRVMDLLDFDPADDTKVPQDVALGGPERINQWRNERMALRDEHIFNTLEDLANKGDQRADQLLTAIEEAGGRNDGDGVAMGYLEGRDYLRQSMADEDRRAIQSRAMGLARFAGKVGAAGAKGAMGFGKAMWDSARGEWKAKKNAQGEADSGFGAILRAELGEGDQGEMAAFVNRLADRIELGLIKWKRAPTQGEDLKLPYNITALASDMRDLYGERAVQVVEQLAAQQPIMAPGLEALRAEVEAQGTQAGRERTYLARVVAANRMMSLVPAAQRGSLGGSGRMHLLNLVERVAEGSAEPGLREALTKAVGAKALAKMLEIANGVTNAKDTQRESSMFGDRPSDDGPSLGSGDDSNSAADRTENKEQVGDYEKRAADKRSRQGRAPSLYGFSRVPTLRNSVRDKDIFGPIEKKEKKTAGEKDEPVRRPELFKRDQKLKSGANAIEARALQMMEYLGVRPFGLNDDQNGWDSEDPYEVTAQSALDIMRRLGMQPAKMMALFRDYMRQEAGEEGMDPALAQKYQELAAQAADAVLDQMDQLDAQKDDKKGGKKDDKKVDKKAPRLTEQQLDKLTKNMQRYFSERFVAVAEQLADRVPEKLTAGEIDDLVKRARASLKKIEGKAEKGSTAYKRMVAESNTLFFKMKSPKGGAVAVEVPVRVKDLVRWVREQRNLNERWEDDPAGWKKDDVFLADVLSGINAMLASGRMAKALPYMRNNFGGVESFADGIPDSLRLVTQPMWQITKRKRERAAKQAADARAGDDRSRIVDPEGDENQTTLMREYGPDATQGENIDASPADENAPVDWTMESMTAEELAQYEALQTPKERAAFRKALGLRKTGEGFVDTAAAPAPRLRKAAGGEDKMVYAGDMLVTGRRDPKTDDPNATPLDFYPKRKEGEAYDERDDALYRTKQGGKSAYSPLDYEPPMTAMGRVMEDRADRIRRALLGDFVLARELNALGAKATTLKPAQVAEIDRAQRNGLSMLIDRIRTAARPTYAKGDEAVGGIHYLYPALVALKPENIEDYTYAGGSSPFLEDTLQNLREVAFRMVLDSSLSDEKKLAAVKLAVSEEVAEKLNLANFKKYAERNAMPFHIPMAPTNEKVLNTLERIVPTYRDTTRDVSKKPVVPQEQQVGGRSLYQRSLTAPWGQSLSPRDHQILNQPFHKFQGTRLREMAIRIKNSVADPVEGRALARQFRADVQATSTQSANANFKATALSKAEQEQYESLKTDEQRKQFLARKAEVMTDFQFRTAGTGAVQDWTPEQLREYNALRTDKQRQAYLAQARGVKVRKLNPQPVVQQVENAEARAMKYLEYLNNPPASYEPKHAVGIRRWANTVLAESTDEDVRSAARLLLKKADSVIEGDQSLTALEDTAGSEVPAQGPKSQSRPGGVRKLNGRSPYLAKDQRKADQATKFIGRGSPASSTAQYARDLKDIANTGQYTADDVVFISAEGIRSGRLDPDFAEIRKAIKAGATFITDDAANRNNRNHNVGERQVAKFLTEEGYRESSPGRWTPAGAADWSGQGRKLNAMSTQIHNDLGRDGFAATHDSPIRHAGVFNWRAHQGKGEGNAAFGAGTYLSTAEGVHKSYKAQFTAMMVGDSRFKGLVGMHALNVLGRIRAEMPSADMARVFSAAEAELDELATNGPVAKRPVYRLALKDIRADREVYERALNEKSPTYEVSVNIAPEQLLDWDAPLNEQSALVQRALKGALKGVVGMEGAKGGEIYQFLAEDLARRADDAADSFKAMAEVDGQALASDYLQSLGILGHKYAAAGGKNDKFPNYVIYDDSKITTNYVHFNAQANGPYSGWKAGTPSTDREVAQAKAYIDRVLGPQIKVDFEKTMGHSGEWIEASETIKIALNAAAGIMPTAYHEALHAFFSKYVKSNPKVLNVMKALAENEQVLARVYALLDGYPAAQAQLRDGEERLAYIYQFWAAGQLDLPTPQARTWAQKLMKFFRQVLGRVKAEERAGAILAALHEGKLREPDAAQRVLAELVADKAWTTKARRNFDGLMQGAAALAMPSHSILLESASPTARRLADLFFANPGDESAGGKVGYLNAVRNERTRRTNAIGKAIEGLSEKDQAAVVRYLQQAKDPAQIPFEPHANAVRTIRAELDDFWIYSANAGVDLGRIKDYFPVVWDTEVLIAKRKAFIQMMMEHYRPQLEKARASAFEKNVRITLEEAASRLHSVIVDRQVFDGRLAVGREDGVLIPFFEASNKRVLDWIAPEHREPFLDKSLVGTLSRYFHQGVRAAEYTRRFGADGEQLELRLDDIKDELREAAWSEPGLDTADARKKWVRRQYRDVRNAVAAMEGTLGKDITDTHRKINSWMIVYQNIRLLPLSLFSSFVDPLSMVARGADFKTAGEAFLNGLREVFRGWRDMIAGMPKDRQKDEWEKMAEFVGTTESAIFAHYVAETYSSQYMSPRAKRINDMMFKLNGMEAWNRAMRVGATKGAVQFIIKHKDSPEQHSQRWLKELGLTSEDIVVRDGKLIVDKAELMALGMNDQKAEDISMKNKAAINRWVEGAVLTPNSAQRPAWSSDPRWSFLFHLKQFTYSFHQTILKRVWGEIKHGNLAPAGVMAMFIPTMIASDITKGLIQGGGDLPAHMKGMDAGDWVLRGAERSGVLGYGQIGVDTGADWSSLAGPSVEQVIDGFRQPIGETIVKALPANPLYREAFR